MISTRETDFLIDLPLAEYRQAVACAERRIALDYGLWGIVSEPPSRRPGPASQAWRWLTRIVAGRREQASTTAGAPAVSGSRSDPRTGSYAGG